MVSTKGKVGKKRILGKKFMLQPATQAPTASNASQQQTRTKPSPRGKPGFGKPSGSKSAAGKRDGGHSTACVGQVQKIGRGTPYSFGFCRIYPFMRVPHPSRSL